MLRNLKLELNILIEGNKILCLIWLYFCSVFQFCRIIYLFFTLGTGTILKPWKSPSKREICFLILLTPPDLLLLLIKKQAQAPGALLLVQPHPNSVSSIALVPLPETHALGKAQHFLRKGRKREGENEKCHEEPTGMLNARYERER